MKHTPGPWIYENGHVSGDKGEELVAKLFGFDQKERKANGKLIGTSPEMLQLLIEAKEVLLQLDTRLNGTCYNPGSVGNCECTLCKISKVIKKATE